MVQFESASRTADEDASHDLQTTLERGRPVRISNDSQASRTKRFGICAIFGSAGEAPALRRIIAYW